MQDSPIKRRKLSLSLKLIVCLVFSILLVAAACASMMTFVYVMLKRNPVYSYSVVFDAGSSHTLMTVYRWLGDKSNGRDGTSLVDEIASLNRDVAITRLVKDREHLASNIRRYFDPFISVANKVVPMDARRDTPILLGATAGMRLLAIQDGRAANMLVNQITIYMQSMGYRTIQRGIRIISGEEEALSAWISVNTMTSILYPRGVKLATQRPYGALDLGGASTQIAFAIDDNDNGPVHRVKVFGKTYKLAVYSFLCLGKAQVRIYYDALLVDRMPPHARSLEDPCMMRGDARTISPLDTYNEPCHMGVNYTRWNERYGLNRTSGSKRPTNILFKGTGDSDKCRYGMQIFHSN